MKFKLDSKLIIDHYIGGPLAWSLNLFAQILAPFLNRNHTLVEPPRTVLFLKFIGLGSIVRASFLLPALKREYPQCKIAFAVFPGCAPVVKLYKEVDEIVVVSDKNPIVLIADTLKLISWCWRNNVDLVIDLEVHAKYSSLISALSLARDRAGFAGATSRFRRGLYTHLVFWNPIRFVDHAYKQLGASLGLTCGEHAKLCIPDSAIEEGERYLDALGVTPGMKLVGINPNASELRSERRWPREYFAALIEMFPAGQNIAFFLVGAPSEWEYAEGVRMLVKRGQYPVHNIAGKISFAAFVYILQKFSVFITNDSGPLHLARTFTVPTVSLWGPTHPVNYSPRGANHISVYHPIYCSPCTHASDTPPCGGDNQCLKQIPPSRVYKAVCSLLGADRNSAAIADPSVESEYSVLGYWQRESVPLTKKIHTENKQ